MAIRKAGDFLIVFILNGAYRFLLLKSLSSYILEFFFIETQLNFKIMKKLLCCFIRWSIVGSGNCYCYPNGDYCSINVYSPGSYRLVCDVYVNGVRVDGVTTYITVMP